LVIDRPPINEEDSAKLNVLSSGDFSGKTADGVIVLSSGEIAPHCRRQNAQATSGSSRLRAGCCFFCISSDGE
jgi:hypothetical protein